MFEMKASEEGDWYRRWYGGDDFHESWLTTSLPLQQRERMLKSSLMQNECHLARFNHTRGSSLSCGCRGLIHPCHTETQSSYTIVYP